MKKIRILALILALLMLPISILVGCKKPDDDTDPSECRHKWTRYTEISERDCVTPLVRERTCTKCGEKEVDTKPAYGHTLAIAVSDNNASCTEDGTKTKKCSRCDYSETEADNGSALGHTFPDSRYIVSEDDPFIESAVCVKCEAATDYRLLGLNIDFEGDKNHLSYTKLDKYFVEGAGAVETKVEGEGEDANTFLSIKRDDSVFVGSSAFGIILTPRADMLKGTSEKGSPYYVIEFDVRISKTETKDLILLSGTKKGVTENFIKYNSEDGTLVTTAGAVYSFKDSDYGEWTKISVVLNDGSKEYTVYVDGYQILYNKDGEVATELAYATVDGYYLGYDVENFKIGLTHEVGVASSFDIDNIQHYLGSQPKEEVYKGSADPEYFIHTTVNGDKIVYKIADESCEHIWGDTTVVEHTCVSTGYSIHTCSECGGQEIDVSTEALVEHDFKEINVIPATCTEAAFRQEQCSKCNIKNGTSIGVPTGHEIDKEADSTRVIEPTCTESGYTVGLCINCNIEHKVDYVSELGHEIDMSKPETYEVIEPTCLSGGYTIGHCKRCDVADYKTDKKEPLGHLIDTTAADYVKVVVSCDTDGYEKSTCGREGCSEIYTTNEMMAYGHNIVSEIKTVPVEGSATGETKRVVASKCARCTNADSQRELSTKVPTYDELVSIVGTENILGESDKAGILHFDGDKTPAGTVYGDDSAASGGLDGVFVACYSKYAIYDDSYKTGNRYMEWVYSPKNGAGVLGDNGNQISRDSYFDVATNKTEKGKDVTFEISLRIPKDVTEIIPLNINVMDRSKMHFTEDHDVTFVNVNKDGVVSLAGGQKIAQLVQQNWTRLAFVFHTTNAVATYDVYVDGVMIEKNVMIELSKPNQKAFEIIDYGFRVNTADSGANVTRKIDVDEVYAYYSNVPAYVTDVNLIEKSGMSAFDPSMNTSEGHSVPYLKRYGLYDADAPKYIKLVYKNNTRFFIDEDNGNAFHFLKNSGVANVPGKSNGSDSYIDINIAHDNFSNSNTSFGDNISIGKQRYQYKSIVFETEITINEGTGNFEILTGRKGGDQQFLVYKSGNIVSGSDIIVQGVETGRKYTLAVVMREDACNYDIYVDGYLVRERVPYKDAYCIEDIGSSVMFRVFKCSGNADILIHSINVYGGNETPLLNLGRQVSVKVDEKYVTNAVVFTEDYDYTVHYPSTKKANGDYVYNSKNSTLEIVSGLEKPENDLNLGLVKVDKDGKIGDEAVNEPVWALKTGDWGANCTTSDGELEALRFYPQNVPMNGDYYDFTGYESITFKYYVAESAGYKFPITMNCPSTGDKNCFYIYYVTIEAGTTGWQELTLKFSDFTTKNTVALNQIQDICFYFSGWASEGVGTPSEDRPGKAGSGTTLYIAGIDLVSGTTEKIIGTYIEGSENFCRADSHIMGEAVTVEPSAHADGYSYKTCTVEGCGYIIVEKLEGSALGHVASGEPRSDSVAATCKAGGKIIYDVTCDICGDIVVGGKTYKTSHNWVKSEAEGASKEANCTEDGYDTYTCSAGCNATAKVILPKLGHTKDENVDTIVVEADCENGGYKQDHCSVCGQDYKYDESEPIGTGEHDYGTGPHTQEASADAEGCIYNECTVCGHKEVIEIIPAVFVGTQDLKFVIKGDMAVIERYTGTATEIVIPATYAGKSVVIAKNSFSGNTSITSITLSEGITEIGVSVFEGCTSLETIVIPESITKIEIFAFKDCDSLTTVNYAGAAKLVEGDSFKANGNDKFFNADWELNYVG